jgi:uncharacterized protein YkwD
MGKGSIRFVALAFTVLCVWVVAAPAGAAPEQQSRSLSALEQGVLADLNGLRKEHGLAPLRVSTSLSAAARQHSSEMAARGYFSHSSANGSSFDKRISRYYPMGRSRFWSVGENLLWSSPDVDAGGALEMWWNSPEHRKNMLTGRWREIGISAVHVAAAPGTYGGREVTIVTTDFGVRR